jgi:hypothetical protein
VACPQKRPTGATDPVLSARRGLLNSHSLIPPETHGCNCRKHTATNALQTLDGHDATVVIYCFDTTEYSCFLRAYLHLFNPPRKGVRISSTNTTAPFSWSLFIENCNSIAVMLANYRYVLIKVIGAWVRLIIQDCHLLFRLVLGQI